MQGIWVMGHTSRVGHSGIVDELSAEELAAGPGDAAGVCWRVGSAQA